MGIYHFLSQNPDFGRRRKTFLLAPAWFHQKSLTLSILPNRGNNDILGSRHSFAGTLLFDLAPSFHEPLNRHNLLSSPQWKYRDSNLE
jgi:hypothetical protein